MSIHRLVVFALGIGLGFAFTFLYYKVVEYQNLDNLEERVALKQAQHDLEVLQDMNIKLEQQLIAEAEARDEAKLGFLIDCLTLKQPLYLCKDLATSRDFDGFTIEDRHRMLAALHEGR